MSDFPSDDFYGLSRILAYVEERQKILLPDGLAAPEIIGQAVWCDGACIPSNPGPGGWAWVAPDVERFASGCEPFSTNQRMEVMAALSALHTFKSGQVTIVSDSKYVVDCFNQRWYDRWQRNGWHNSSGKPVANEDLWRQMIEVFDARQGELTFRWVKGHAGHRWNEMADRLANKAATTQRSAVEPTVKVISRRRRPR